MRAMDGRSCLDRDAHVWAKRSLFREGSWCRFDDDDELGVDTVRDAWGRLRTEEDTGLDVVVPGLSDSVNSSGGISLLARSLDTTSVDILNPPIGCDVVEPSPEPDCEATMYALSDMTLRRPPCSGDSAGIARYGID